ncbi:hypothetical protein NDU88_000941 [Pleurodeles waltl]|uniref:CCHC-type domain-containing protein n=1 Tax=Pleurodeles waltl TaxID=8319 RepID=A0AAV7N9E9_PLEWA|nr:hypothetical protein NDU88_000941 [Pleurodeles waltl]
MSSGRCSDTLHRAGMLYPPRMHSSLDTGTLHCAHCLVIYFTMQQFVMPPVFFLASPGLPLVEWEQWKEGFEAYLDAVEGEMFEHKRQFALLKHFLGIEGRKILKHLPRVSILGHNDDVDGYASAIKALDVRFMKTNVIMKRHKFYKRHQLPGEPVENFVSDLRMLASTCGYKHFEDQIIRDQIVEKSNSVKVQEKLLTLENLTLEKAIEVAGNIKLPTKFMEQRNIKEEVHAVSHNMVKNKELKDASLKEKKVKVRKPLECYRCGSRRHLGNSSMCPAVDKYCSKCRKKGHFMKMCKMKWDSQKKKVVNVVENDTSEEVRSDSDEEGVVFTVEHEQKEILLDGELVTAVCGPGVRKPLWSINVNGASVNLMADSGFWFKEECKNLLEVRLEKTKAKPMAYGEKPVDVIGGFSAKLEFKGCSANATVYVVEDGSNLLGWLEQRNLDIVLDPNSPEQVMLRKGIVGSLDVSKDKRVMVDVNRTNAQDKYVTKKKTKCVCGWG